MSAPLVELQRCRDSASVEDLVRILEAAGIPHRLGTDAACVDVSSIGTGSEAQVIVSVRQADFEAAREAMERDSLEVDLPDDHYLRTFTDEEIEEIVAKPDEWSAFDVAHARRLMKQRGIVPARVEALREEYQQEKLRRLRAGVRASTRLLLLGWCATLLGGLLGFVIGFSLCYSTEKTPEGEVPTYDAWSREMGKCMLLISCLTSILTFIWLLIGR
ncbi:MAG: hypothetical protein EOP87_03080 [Verrucomicrobiaceae bacterium]|nr:MAG: hypothetical protein EOP87_03080 [Verrucomicrobiaceae bacterium]